MSTGNPITNLPYNKSVLDEYYELMTAEYISNLDKQLSSGYVTTSSNNITTHNTTSPYTMYPTIGGSLANSTNPWATTTTTTGSGVTWGNTSSWSTQDNIFHNPTGPAAITKSDVKWYIDGKQIYSTKLFCELANHTDQSTMFWLLTYGEKLPATPAEYKYLETDLND